MVSIRSIALALAGAAVAFAQTNGTSAGPCNANCFNVPTGGYSVTAGQSVSLSWNPSTSGTVSLYLRDGLSNALSSGTPIATGIANSGSFTWNVPSTIPRSSSSAIEIRSDADPSVSNYTPQFNINSDVIAASSASAAVSATASVTITSTLSSGSVASTLTTTKASTSGSASTTASSASAGLLTTRTSGGLASRATAFVGVAGVMALGALAL